MFVSLSTMPAGDIENLKKYVKEIQSFADFLHCDICDGKYNKTSCFSPEMACQINEITTLPLDCHLMTKNAIDFAKEYIKNGANIVTAQIESFDNHEQILKFIEYVKNKNVLVGLALESETEIRQILPYIEKLDVVLVMSVKTGASGQNFDNSIIEKVEYLANLKKHQKMKFLIEVDGGINGENAEVLKKSGAEILVSGNFVYNSKDREKAVELLK